MRTFMCRVTLLAIGLFTILATTHGKRTCEVSFRKAKSLTESQVLEVAKLAFEADCKIGEFPGLGRSIDPLCHQQYTSCAATYGLCSCRDEREKCQRLVSADGSAILVVNDDSLAPIGLYFAKDGLNFLPTALAKSKKEIARVKDWAEDSDDEGKKIHTNCARDFDISIDGVAPPTANLCNCDVGYTCMTADILAEVLHLKLRKYEAQEVLCHAGNCMTPQRNVLNSNGWETMAEYCRSQDCTREIADVYKAIVFGFSRRGGVMLSIVHGTGTERMVTILGQLVVWAFSITVLSFLLRKAIAQSLEVMSKMP